MKVLLQRVSEASVEVRGEGTPREVARIGKGLLLFVGIGKADTAFAILSAIQKISELRIFPDEAGRFDRSVKDVGGDVLIVSQFTLFGNTTKGRRPDFFDAMPPKEAETLYRAFIEAFSRTGIPVQSGDFGANMGVSLLNDGPVTLMLEF